jgi:hypothetical protein
MLGRRLKVSLEIKSSTETKQAGEAHKLVANSIVVFKVVLQTPLVIESAQAKVAIYFMAQGVVHVIFEAIAVFENALAQITVVLVVWHLLDVAEKSRLAMQLERADTAPVLVRVIDLVCSVCCRS